MALRDPLIFNSQFAMYNVNVTNQSTTYNVYIRIRRQTLSFETSKFDS